MKVLDAITGISFGFLLGYLAFHEQPKPEPKVDVQPVQLLESLVDKPKEFDTLAYILRGDYNLKKGKINQALSNYENAVDINPKNSKAYVKLFETMSKLPEDELKIYTDAWDKNLQNKESFANRVKCNAAHTLLKTDTRIGSDHMINMYPDEAVGYYCRAFAYAGKDNDQALFSINKAIQKDSKQAEFYIARASIASHKGNREEYMKDYFKAVELDPNIDEGYKILTLMIE